MLKRLALMWEEAIEITPTARAASQASAMTRRSGAAAGGRDVQRLVHHRQRLQLHGAGGGAQLVGLGRAQLGAAG